MTKEKEMYYIDALKGIGILMVLLGHGTFHPYAADFVYLFHMPLFFFISGFLDKMQYKSFGEMVKRKAARLLYPYVVFGILITIYNTLFEVLRGITTEGKVAKRIIALVYGNLIWENNSDYIGTLWFLVGLFCAGLLAYGLYQLAKKSKIKIWIAIPAIIVLGAGACWMKNRFGIRLPWCLDVAFIAALFYFCGIMWRKWESRQKYETMPIGISLMAFGMVAGVINVLYMKEKDYAELRVDMLQMNYGIIPLFVLSALTMSLGLMIIVKKIWDRGRLKILEKIGKRSLLIMIVHIYIFQILILVMNRLGCYHWLLFFPIALLLSIAAAAVIDCFLPFLYKYKINRRRN